MPKKLKLDDTTDNTNPSFEVAVAQLANIVEQLESGELPLETALQLFEQGTQLVKKSQNVLDRAERRVEQLLGFDENGKPVTTTLGNEPDGDPE